MTDRINLTELRENAPTLNGEMIQPDEVLALIDAVEAAHDLFTDEPHSLDLNLGDLRWKLRQFDFGDEAG
jgi:hypothetical protein